MTQISSLVGRIGFLRLRVDFGQFITLTRVFIKRDFKESSMAGSFNYGRSGARGFIGLMAFYLLSGIAFIPIVQVNESLFVSAALLISYTGLMIGSLILIEYHSIVIAPEDIATLGHLPINSRTFFFAKLVNLLFYVALFTIVLGTPGICAIWLSHDNNLLIGLFGLLTVMLANITFSLIMVLFYVGVLALLKPNIVKNLLAFLQITLSLVIYCGFIFLPKLAEFAALQNLSLTSAPWLAFLPSAWFAGIWTLASESRIAAHWYLAFPAFGLLSLTVMVSARKLSLRYASVILETEQDVSGVANGKKMPFFTLNLPVSNEVKIVAKLIRRQFLRDRKFKMSVLGILPLSVFYFLVGAQNGPLLDPFFYPAVEFKRQGLLYLIVFLFPVMLRTFLTQSDAYRASWIFLSTPADTVKLVLAGKNYLMIYFVTPFLFLLCLLFSIFFSSLLHVLIHILFLAIISHLILQIAYLRFPDLPFSRPNVKGQRSRKMAWLMVLIPLLIYLGLPVMFSKIYSSNFRCVLFALILILFSFLLEFLLKIRIRRSLSQLEFD